MGYCPVHLFRLMWFDMPGLQYWFTGAALAAFIGLVTAISTLGFAWYLAAVNQMASASSTAASAEQKRKTEQVKDLLGKAIASGTKLIAEQKDKDEAQAEKDAEIWVTRTRDLIAMAYGDGEAALFLNDSGYTFFSSGGRIRNWIDGRLRRITELLRRTDSLTVRIEFDSTKFN